jgi:hypothetical protein
MAFGYLQAQKEAKQDAYREETIRLITEKLQLENALRKGHALIAQRKAASAISQPSIRAAKAAIAKANGRVA